jgi:16S rRNA (cytosine967-C5)-methyltransferase
LNAVRRGTRSQPASARATGLAARSIALEILLEVERRGGFADALLGRRIPALEAADRRLATRIVLGTLAWRARLDFELERLTKRDLDNIQPAALEIMRIGIFQLRFLDRIPKHAVVSTSVELAKHAGEAKVAAGFINAVLRRAARETIALPDRESDEAGFLALAYSHPRWLVERMVDWYGREGAERAMAANNEAAPNAIRLNLARATRDEIAARLAADGMEIDPEGRFPETAVLAGAPRFDCDSFRAGLFQPQSEASQMIARMLAPQEGATVVDLAAAPGGKTTHLAELVGASGLVIGFDVNLAGVRNARAVAARLGRRNVSLVQGDAAAALPMRPRCADAVLLDAPCTGLGTLREHPEIRWRVGPGDPARMSLMQAAMLANAAASVRRGGALVYSVCSVAPEEGEQVVRAFLRERPEFLLEPPPQPSARALADLIDADGFMRTRSDRGGLDGFFAARMVRRRD